MIEPIFVDLNGNTARIDPQRSPVVCMRLTIISAQENDDTTGNLIARGQVVESFITADQADALADALRRGRSTS